MQGAQNFIGLRDCHKVLTLLTSDFDKDRQKRRGHIFNRLKSFQSFRQDKEPKYAHPKA